MNILTCCTTDNKPNFKKEKHGYRCSICGKFYPFLQIKHKDKLIDPKELSKFTGKVFKYKKSAVAFFNDHYYAQRKNTLLKIEIDESHQSHQCDTIRIMSNVYHIAISPDEKYAITETFSGTLEVIDLLKKEAVARKGKCPVNGAFIFTDNQEILYAYSKAIRCWNFLQNTDTVVWEVPTDWMKNEKGELKYNAVCTNVIYNPHKQCYLFQFSVATNSYIVAAHNKQVIWQKRFDHVPTRSKLVYSEGINQYTLSKSNKVTIYDEELCAVKSIVSPSLFRISDGGGMFPITKLEPHCPDMVYISMDGKWILLNYFTSAIMMRISDQKILFCLFSYDGKVAQNMGFIDDSYFWYTWGDTTYIQEIAEEKSVYNKEERL